MRDNWFFSVRTWQGRPGWVKGPSQQFCAASSPGRLGAAPPRAVCVVSLTSRLVSGVESSFLNLSLGCGPEIMLTPP